MAGKWKKPVMNSANSSGCYFGKLYLFCKQFCLRCIVLSQVQLRLSQKTIEELDRWVAEGRFKSRSDAIRNILNYYQEREKTREFYKLLNKKSKEAKEHPETLIPLEELE